MQKFNPEKELYKIQHGNRNKVILFVISLLIVGIIGYSFALYQVRYSKRIIYTKVAPFSNKDIELAVYLDGEPSSESDFPEKNSGYVYEKTVCDNNSTAFFDNVGWNLYLKANKKDKCNVYFITNDSEPNPPELYQGLIPVTFDDSGKVYVANLTNNDWYNYDEKRWANAVLVSTAKYNDLVYNGLIKEEKYGAEISMNDILQMYVWIPRYKYQLFNAINGEGVDPQEIQIQFEKGTASTGNVSCEIDTKGKEKCENDVNGNWFTHPAFKFGNTELTGIWVGKFESSHTTKSKGGFNVKTDADATLKCIDNNCAESNYIRIIPNVTSLRYNNLSNFFYVSRSIEKTNNVYNLNSKEIDTHMMKNMEWGVMAYLTHSKYGRCDGVGSCTEVAINTNSGYTTGYNGTSYSWNTVNGQLASTTGNMYGIYDINGGALEYMMSVTMIDTVGSAIHYSNSGFISNTMPEPKYYELYEYDSVETSYRRGHLGDATRETLKILGNIRGGWYDDNALFPNDTLSWFERGGHIDYDINSGIFASGRNTGRDTLWHSFRVVLTTQDGDE